MKKDVAMFEKGVIVDFAGIEHPFIVCALSTSNFQTEEHSVEIVSYDNDAMEIDSLIIPRAVFIGISVCNPGSGLKSGDEWNEEKGKLIALNRAKGFKADKIEKSAALFATRGGLISEPLVKAILQKEVQHVIEDPEYAIKGYNQMKLRYEREQERKKYIDESPDNLKGLVNQFIALSTEDRERVVTLMFLKADE
jgi:hypothetical protein